MNNQPEPDIIEYSYVAQATNHLQTMKDKSAVIVLLNTDFIIQL